MIKKSFLLVPLFFLAALNARATPVCDLEAIEKLALEQALEHLKKTHQYDPKKPAASQPKVVEALNRELANAEEDLRLSNFHLMEIRKATEDSFRTYVQNANTASLGSYPRNSSYTVFVNDREVGTLASIIPAPVGKISASPFQSTKIQVSGLAGQINTYTVDFSNRVRVESNLLPKFEARVKLLKQAKTLLEGKPDSASQKAQPAQAPSAEGLLAEKIAKNRESATQQLSNHQKQLEKTPPKSDDGTAWAPERIAKTQRRLKIAMEASEWMKPGKDGAVPTVQITGSPYQGKITAVEPVVSSDGRNIVDYKITVTTLGKDGTHYTHSFEAHQLDWEDPTLLRFRVPDSSPYSKSK